MLRFRATSTRITDGHGANCFSMSQPDAEKWAKTEQSGGYDAVVYEVREVETARFDVPRCPKAGCRRVLKVGAEWCDGCGIKL